MESIPQAIKKRLSFNNLLFLLILVLAAYLRLYRLQDYLTFLGDEGRDVTIARRIIVENHPALIGPQTSIGNMYLGPLYYYLITPSLSAFNFSPLGPAVMVALIGVCTVALIYHVSRIWFDQISALCATALYAVSSTVLVYSRSSWNPNIMPFFALLTIWSIWEVWQRQSLKFFIIGSVAYAFVLQSHYLGLLLFPTIFIFILMSWIRSDSNEKKKFNIYASIGLLCFTLLMSPLFIFDARHGFINLNAMNKFFTIRQETVNLKPFKAIPHLWPLFVSINTSLITGTNILFGKLVSPLIFAGLIVGVTSNKNRKLGVLLFSWLFFGLIGLGLYKQTIYDHYYGFLYPLPFFAIATLTNRLIKYSLFKIGLFLIIVSLIFVNIQSSPLKKSPNYQMARTQSIADFIKEITSENSFNLALIAKRNYDSGYRYFLSLNQANLYKIEDKLTDQLFVICEDPVCEPINHPSAEIANFGWAKIDQEWRFPWGVKLFKLIHSK